MVSTANYIRHYSLKDSQFQNILKKIESEYVDVLYWTQLDEYGQITEKTFCNHARNILE